MRLHYRAQIVCRRTTCAQATGLDIDPGLFKGTPEEVIEQARGYATAEFLRQGWTLEPYQLCPTCTEAKREYEKLTPRIQQP